MQLIDTHCHVFGSQFSEDITSVFARAKATGVAFSLLPNIDGESIPLVCGVIENEKSAKPMWGLHPCHVFANWREELSKIEPLFQTHPAVAVGEIGLDFYWSKEFIDEQKDALEFQLNWALAKKLPVSLHTREANTEAIEIVKPFASRGLRGVFHCFSGTLDQGKEITDFGFCLGIGGNITYKKNPLKDFIGLLPLESIVLETDSPYLAPVPYRGKRNEPAYLIEVVYELANLFKLSPDEISKTTSKTAISLFNLDPA
jgi:TatD DNase family protein